MNVAEPLAVWVNYNRTEWGAWDQSLPLRCLPKALREVPFTIIALLVRLLAVVEFIVFCVATCIDHGWRKAVLGLWYAGRTIMGRLPHRWQYGYTKNRTWRPYDESFNIQHKLNELANNLSNTSDAAYPVKPISQLLGDARSLLTCTFPALETQELDELHILLLRLGQLCHELASSSSYHRPAIQEALENGPAHSTTQSSRLPSTNAHHPLAGSAWRTLLDYLYKDEPAHIKDADVTIFVISQRMETLLDLVFRPLQKVERIRTETRRRYFFRDLEETSKEGRGSIDVREARGFLFPTLKRSGLEVKEGERPMPRLLLDYFDDTNDSFKHIALYSGRSQQEASLSTLIAQLDVLDDWGRTHSTPGEDETPTITSEVIQVYLDLATAERTATKAKKELIPAIVEAVRQRKLAKHVFARKLWGRFA